MQHLLVICTLLLAGQSARGFAADAAPDLVYPGKTWATKTPGEVGMDPEKLRALSTFVGGRGCVVRRGYMVYTWGDVGRRADVASAAKPFYSFFLFKAIAKPGAVPNAQYILARAVSAEHATRQQASRWRLLLEDVVEFAPCVLCPGHLDD